MTTIGTAAEPAGVERERRRGEELAHHNFAAASGADEQSLHGAAFLLARGHVRLQAERVAAFKEYKSDVDSGAYPAVNHEVSMNPAELDRFKAALDV